MEMKKEMEPTGDLWIPECRKKNGKCNMLIRSAYFDRSVRSAAQPSQDIARICMDNPNRFSDAQVIMAAPKLFWACVTALEYFGKDNSEWMPDHCVTMLKYFEKDKDNSKWMLDHCMTMLKEAVQLARNGYSPELRDKIKNLRYKPCKFEDCPEYVEALKESEEELLRVTARIVAMNEGGEWPD